MNLEPKPATVAGPEQTFTGRVWFDVLCGAHPESAMRVNRVRFAPGARTAWHAHPGGQTLHVTQGVALMGTRDGTVLVVHPGETVYTPPGEEHWHGATPDDFMEHLAMWEDQPGNGAVWAEHVSDADYARR
ncbi:(R)-mandelonitrile lyase [Protaetiibacter mangrovi]|uniref:Cupin domain-containing protein n=1 Tax=Protaetiibacter mangrovi TaxID=2970926 RepID=A0ABT1ZGQ6_9MICO|nr:cupin domain-containing protein [Protaetiibacter mangrovi]MCS0499865.1 cupin domain-containing protein [Protaetiibacter mangrovi]TPW93623.1 cupin domain-containing protein [Schumannella luteola]